MPADLGGIRVHVATAEDTVLAKLERARLGGSERHLRDIVGILLVSSDTIDMDYLRRWAPELDVADGLDRALADAEAQRPPEH